MDLKLPAIGVVSLIAIIILLLLGDYLGHKFGRGRVGVVGGITILVLVVLYAVYAIVAALLGTS